ncbi:MAG: UDP-glucose/GDP-mannose dehydrogenase family protein [bacterium]
MNICMIGVGYVGLVAGTCFAENGNEVVCMDVDEPRIKVLQKGESPIYERGLDDILERNVNEGRLRFTTKLEDAVPESEVVFIAVGTPAGDHGKADLSAVYEVAKQIGKLISDYTVIVMKSTVPVGTTHELKEIIKEQTDVPFDMVMNPEFMKEGAAIDDFMKPDRVVIGTESEKAGKIMTELYEPFVRTEKPILQMDIRSAETTKYAANAMLATKISFINEMANVCEKTGADIAHVRRGIGFDSRIGFQFLFPGLGYGGSCFPKDVEALIQTARQFGHEPHLIEATQKVNRGQRKWMTDKIDSHFDGVFEEPIAVWGLSFKPQTDDLREAPAIDIIKHLLDQGAEVRAYDPVANENAARVLGDKVIYCDTAYEALGGASALVIVTEWNEFRRPNFKRIAQLMKQKIIFDGRNLYDPESMKDKGFTYYSVGRKSN